MKKYRASFKGKTSIFAIMVDLVVERIFLLSPRLNFDNFWEKVFVQSLWNIFLRKMIEKQRLYTSKWGRMDQLLRDFFSFFFFFFGYKTKFELLKIFHWLNYAIHCSPIFCTFQSVDVKSWNTFYFQYFIVDDKIFEFRVRFAKYYQLDCIAI